MGERPCNFCKQTAISTDHNQPPFRYGCPDLVLQLFIISKFLYPPIVFIFLVKLSLRLLFVKLSRPHSRLSHVIYFGIVITFLFDFSSMVSIFDLCILDSGENFESVQTSRYQGTGNLKINQGSVDILSDFYLLGINVTPILKLPLQMKRKIRLLLGFMIELLWVIPELACYPIKLLIHEAHAQAAV